MNLILYNCVLSISLSSVLIWRAFSTIRFFFDSMFVCVFFFFFFPSPQLFIPCRSVVRISSKHKYFLSPSMFRWHSALPMYSFVCVHNPPLTKWTEKKWHFNRHNTYSNNNCRIGNNIFLVLNTRARTHHRRYHNQQQHSYKVRLFIFVAFGCYFSSFFFFSSTLNNISFSFTLSRSSWFSCVFLFIFSITALHLSDSFYIVCFFSSCTTCTCPF